MTYMGVYRRMYSEICGEDVVIMKYQMEGNLHKIPYCECTRCGKGIKRTMYVVQSAKTDVELMYLGPECIKHFS